MTGNLGNVQWLDDEHIIFTMAMDENINVFTAKIELVEGRVALSEVTQKTSSNRDYPVRYLNVNISSDPSHQARMAWTIGGVIHVRDVAQAQGGDDELACAVPIKWVALELSSLSGLFTPMTGQGEDWDLHPEGLTIMVLVRGQPFTMGIWDGPVLSYPPATKTKTPSAEVDELFRKLACRAQSRVRHGVYLYDGERLVYVSDASGEEDIEVHWEEADRPAKRLGLHHGLLGRVERLIPSPEAPLVAIVNHRNALLIVNVETGEMRTADKSDESDGIADLDVESLW